MAREEICSWQVDFTLKPPLVLDKVQNLPEIRIVKEDSGLDAKATKIEVTTPKLSYIEAHLYATEVCNRCTDYLTLLKRLPVRATLYNIAQMGPTGSKKTRYRSVSVRAAMEKRQNVDLTAEPIEKIIRGSELKLGRQLSHYRRALETDDVINKIKDLYQVVEDEYGKNHQILERYRYVRHLLSHPKLTRPRLVSQAKERFGRPYIDPSCPTDLRKLEADQEELQKKAEEILLCKIPRFNDY